MPCPAHYQAVRIGGTEFQPWPARLLLCARLSWMVRGPMAAVRLDHRGGHRDVAAAVRLVGAAFSYDGIAGAGTSPSAIRSHGSGNSSVLRPASRQAVSRSIRG